MTTVLDGAAIEHFHHPREFQRTGLEVKVWEGNRGLRKKKVIFFIISIKQQPSEVLSGKLGKLSCPYPLPNSTGTQTSLKWEQGERIGVICPAKAKSFIKERKSNWHQTFQQQCFVPPKFKKQISILKLFQESKSKWRMLCPYKLIAKYRNYRQTCERPRNSWTPAKDFTTSELRQSKGLENYWPRLEMSIRNVNVGAPG